MPKYRSSVALSNGEHIIIQTDDSVLGQLETRFIDGELIAEDGSGGGKLRIVTRHIISVLQLSGGEIGRTVDDDD
jgi:hypothetical protein